MWKWYVAKRTAKGTEVYVVDERTGRRRPLNPRLDLANHSPTGFEWGYGGSGPAQLALAILADATGDDDTALRFYQDFKEEVIARMPRDGFTLSEFMVWQWLKAIGEQTQADSNERIA